MSTFTERIIGAARLDVHTYEEVEADTTAMTQAMGVVVLSSIAQGIAGLTQGGGSAFVVSAVGALVGWFIWAFLVYIIGTKVLPEPQTHSDLGELLRTIGFSASPGLLGVLGVIPLLGGLVMIVVRIWMLIAMIIAVRAGAGLSEHGKSFVGLPDRLVRLHLDCKLTQQFIQKGERRIGILGGDVCPATPLPLSSPNSPLFLMPF